MGGAPERDGDRRPLRLAVPPSSGSRLPGIEGARAVAAASVLVYHCWLFGSPDGTSPRLGPLTGVMPHLALGVILFFSLSGFLLYRPFAAAVLRSRTRHRRLPAQPRPADPARLLGHPAAERCRPPGGAASPGRAGAPARVARPGAGHDGQERPAGPELRSQHAADRHRASVVAGDRGRLLPRPAGAGPAGHDARPARDQPVGAPSGRAGACRRHAAPGAGWQGGRAPRRRLELRVGGGLALGAGAQLPRQCRPVRLRHGPCRVAHRGQGRRGDPAETVAEPAPWRRPAPRRWRRCGSSRRAWGSAWPSTTSSWRSRARCCWRSSSCPTRGRRDGGGSCGCWTRGPWWWSAWSPTACSCGTSRWCTGSASMA